MTQEEVCKKFNVSKSSLTSNFKRTAASILKKYGIKLLKKKENGQIIYFTIEDDKRALSIIEEPKEMFFVDGETMKLEQWEFVVFLAIIVSPMLVFRGSYEEMLNYMNFSTVENYIIAVKAALESLAAKHYIMYVIDETDNNYFMAGLFRAVEQEMNVGIGLVRRSKELADKYNKRNYIPILKTWVQYQICEREGVEYTTAAQIEERTGLNYYSLHEATKILEEENIIKRKFLYADSDLRIGTKTTLNAFDENNA